MEDAGKKDKQFNEWMSGYRKESLNIIFNIYDLDNMSEYEG